MVFFVVFPVKQSLQISKSNFVIGSNNFSHNNLFIQSQPIYSNIAYHIFASTSILLRVTNNEKLTLLSQS